MRKGITTIVVACGIFLSAYLTSSAMAGSFGIGIMGAGAHFGTKGSENEGARVPVGDGAGTADKERTETEEDANAFYGSIFAEYTFGEMYGMTLGVSYTPMNSVIGSGERTDVQTPADILDADITASDAGTYRAKAKVSNHATIYVEPTFMPNDNFGVYLKGGVARVMVNSLEKIAIGENSSAYGDETIHGFMYGLGVKGVYDSGYFFKLEAIHIKYQTVKMTSTTGNKNTIEADPEQTAVRFGIGYTF